MKSENLNIEATGAQIDRAIASFNPFGYLDMQTAVNVALRAGKDEDFVYESVSEFADSCDVKIEDCDPVSCVMDAILQEARNEISDLTNFDFCNDCTQGEIYTAGNFMASSYDYRQESKDELVDALKQYEVVIEDLSDATQYFLSELEISQEDITN